MPASFDTKTSGPLFDGRIHRAMDGINEEITNEVAVESQDQVRLRLDTVLQHPTGHYRSRIAVSRGNPAEVDDSGVIYGPWLEGTGSRNKSTRFKGYRTFRWVTQLMQSKSTDIAKKVISKNIGRLS